MKFKTPVIAVLSLALVAPLAECIEAARRIRAFIEGH